MTEEHQYPSLGDQAKNLAQFSFNVVRSALNSENSLLVTEEVRNERMDTCRSCEYYDAKQVRCRHCGCFLEQKVRFAIDSCPLSKWSVSDENWINNEFDNIVEKIQNHDFEDSEDGTPGFPIEPNLGELYHYTDADGSTVSWQYDGRIWRIVN